MQFQPSSISDSAVSTEPVVANVGTYSRCAPPSNW